MSTFGNAIRVAGVSFVLIGLATGAGAASAGGAKVNGSVRIAAASETAAPSSVGVEVAPVAKAPAPVAAIPGCARKVKVVYAGYGEADRAACSVASATP